MNATLEGMAQALFKSWFVDFDPVIDNALPPAIRYLLNSPPAPKSARFALANGTANHEAAKDFPDSFEFTEELGWIPEGWQVKAVEVANISIGKTHQERRRTGSRNQQRKHHMGFN